MRSCWFESGQGHQHRIAEHPIAKHKIRANFLQTSFDRKMRAYLSAHAAREHERCFGWNTFRVLTVTTDESRLQSMREALADIHQPHSLGPSLFFFATRSALHVSDPLLHTWSSGDGRHVSLL